MAGSLEYVETGSQSDPRTLALLLALFQILMFTWLTGISALIAIPLPPDGIPMTLQTLVVIVGAMGLRTRIGMAGMALYILVGWLGAGVFAGGNAGISVILGQTGGYLLGFLLCQPIISLIVRRRDRSVRGWGAIVAAMLAGHAVIFLLGVPWLAFVRDFSLMRAIEGGFVPFIPGMIIKTAAAIFIGLALWPRSVRRFW
jgi:biotin transport system substrate-specific component